MAVYLAGVAAVGDVLGYIVMSFAIVAIIICLVSLQRLVPRPGDKRNWKQRLTGKL